MWNKALRIYSLIFRFGGLLIAIMSAVVSISLGIEVIGDGYMLVNGEPDSSAKAMLVAVCTPLLGVAFGLALSFLVPQLKAAGEE